MSYPILYDPSEKTFDHNGCGILADCISCVVTEERNGLFELQLKYPFDGIHFSEIKDRSIIKVKANQISQPQLFRVYAKTRPMSGIVTINAEHISYDLSGIPVSPFSADNVQSALSGLKQNAVVDCPFTFSSDKTSIGEFSVKTPSSIRSQLGGSDGGILDVFGGEYEMDNFRVILHNERGMNRGVSIRYGKNLTDIKQDENCHSVFTGVYPYWADINGENLVALDEKIVPVRGNFNFVKIKTLDLSSEYAEKPTQEMLRERTTEYIQANKIGVPEVSLTVSFAQLEQTEEYKNLALLERVSLCDEVNVEFPELGVSATAKAVRIVYDAIQDKVSSVTLGSIRTDLADTVNKQLQDILKKPDKSAMQIAVETLTNAILGANGGSVRLLDTNGDKVPDTLYIADNDDPALAKKVWRFNYEGWGASENGYVGPFTMGATFESGIVAEFITAGTLYGMLLKAGAIESNDGKIRIDLSDTSKTAYFDAGIQSNSFMVVPENKKNVLFRVEERTSITGAPVCRIEANTSAGKPMLRVSEVFDGNGYPSGPRFVLYGDEYETYVDLSADYKGGWLQIKGQNSNAELVSSAGESSLRFSGYGDEAMAIGFSYAGGAYIDLPEVGRLLLDVSLNQDGTYNLIGRLR